MAGRAILLGTLATLLATTGCMTAGRGPGTACMYEFPFMNNYDVINRTTFVWDDSYVTNNPTEYHQELAGPLSALAASTYGARLFTDVRSLMDMGFPPERLARCYGSRLSYRHPKYGRDRVGYTIGARRSELPGADYDILLVLVRGTFGRDEWLSNVNVANAWGAAHDPDPAELPLFHEGFSRATDSVMDALAEYVASNHVDLSKAKILVTGHSRGAAVANLIGARLDKADGTPFAAVRPENVFVYTFASPNVTIRDTEEVKNPRFGNIFNVINPEDLVPNVPMPFWGARRYGRDLHLRSYDHLPPTGSWTHPAYCDMKNAFRDICGYEYYHILLGTDVNDIVQDFARGISPNVASIYWVVPEMRAEGNETSTHSFIEMVLWKTMASADGDESNLTFFHDMRSLTDAYRQITNQKDEPPLLEWDHKLRFLKPQAEDDGPFDPDGRDFSRQPGFTDFSWGVSCTHSFLTYVSWMKSAAEHGPDSVFVDWDE